MTTLMLLLAGPMQSWGAASRFTRRTTELAPTKSGIIGLLAAARGLRRTDPIEELLSVQFGVRVDQPGRIERDFHTARSSEGRSFPLTERFYLTDAVFVAAIGGEPNLVSSLNDAVRRPRFPLYLGRRSCPPSRPISLGLRDANVWDSLNEEEWHASRWWRRDQGAIVDLDVRLDVDAMVDSSSTIRISTHHDDPESFDPTLRRYGWRRVAHAIKRVENPDARALRHEPLAALGGA